MELPAADGELENGSRAGGGQLCGAETRTSYPASVLLLMEIVGDLLPPGVVNVVNGAGGVIGEYLATSKRIAKVALPAQRKWANKLCNTQRKTLFR